MKKRLLCLALVLCLVCSVVFAACNKDDKDAQAAIDALTITQDGTQVTDEFTLPKTIGNYDITWTANPAASLTLTKMDSNWIAEPVRTNSDVSVTLTASITGKVTKTKTFTVIVAKAEGAIDAQTALNRYMLDQDGKQQTDEFTLPKKIGDFDVTWESNNTAALSITARTNDYLATPHRLDDTETVTLTVKSGTTASKTFRVIVPGFGVAELADAFGFSKNGVKVGEDFDLATSITQNGKTATITWKVVEGSETYISVDETNHKCIINKAAITDEHQVSIEATFSYNSKTAKKTYTFTVANVEDHMVAMHKWYESKANDKSNISFEGYVTVFGSDFGSGSSRNVTFYAVDMQGCHGIYSYQTSMKDTTANIKAGSHVLITGGTIDVYNGLYELKQGMVTLLDNEKDNADSYTYAIDDELLGGLDTMKYHTGQLVSLTNWKVNSVTVKDQSAFVTKDYAGSVITLSKGSVTIDIAYNNYMEGEYRTATGTNSSTRKYDPDQRFLDLYEAFGKVTANSYISVTGILSMNANKFQILPRNANDIKTGVEQAASDNGTKVKTAINAVNTAIGTQLHGTVTENLTVANLPQELNGVSIRYRLCNGSAVELTQPGDNTGATIKVTPAKDEEITWIEVSYKIGGTIVSYSFITITSQTLSDAEIVKKVLGDIDAEVGTNYERAADVPLKTTTDYDGVTVTWAVTDQQGNAATYSWLKIENNTLKVTLPDEDSTGYIKVTVTLGDETDDKVIAIHVKAANANVVKLTVDTLGLKSQSYSDKTNAATTTVDNVEIAYIGLGNYGNGIQMNGSYNSRLYTSKGVPAGKIIEKIELTYNHAAGQTSAAEALTISFDANTSFAKDVQKLTFEAVSKGAANKTYTITPNGNWNYVDIKYSATQYAQYWASIVIYLKDGTPDAGTEAPSHTCNDVCDICKKCTTECNDNVCADKCPGHTPTDAFTKVDKSSAPVGNYKLAMWMTTATGGKWIYATGKLTSNGYYFAATEDASQAGTLTIEDKGDGKYAIKNSEGKYLEMYKNNTYYNARLVDSADSLENLWSWNSDLGIFTADLGGATYYLGSYASNAELRPTAITRISDTSVIDKTQFVAYFGNVKAD